ncbi:MAG TPA: dienelactone hydrolase family protein [Ignavibacteriaceae bacterium]|nr:dienelactone hydrolase family protein [Ignavibacteriaceae bacterium]
MKKLFLISILVSTLLIISCGESQDKKVDVVGQEVEYNSEGTVLKGYLAYDKNIEGKRPGVLVVHEWWGHNDYARQRARMLAELGYTALAVDMFGEGQKADHPEDAQKFASAIFSNVQMGEQRFLAAHAFLRDQETVDADAIAAIGYCFGGAVVLHMARIGMDLKAVASFHGGIQAITPAEEGKVKAFVLVCNGADDPFVTQEQIDAFKKEMDDAKVQYEFVNYEGAIHSFTSLAADSLGKKFNMPLAYNENADKESWQELQKVFNKVFSK